MRVRARVGSVIDNVINEKISKQGVSVESLMTLDVGPTTRGGISDYVYLNTLPKLLFCLAIKATQLPSSNPFGGLAYLNSLCVVTNGRRSTIVSLPKRLVRINTSWNAIQSTSKDHSYLLNMRLRLTTLFPLGLLRVDISHNGIYRIKSSPWELSVGNYKSNVRVETKESLIKLDNLINDGCLMIPINYGPGGHLPSRFLKVVRSHKSTRNYNVAICQKLEQKYYRLGFNGVYNYLGLNQVLFSPHSYDH